MSGKHLVRIHFATHESQTAQEYASWALPTKEHNNNHIVYKADQFDLFHSNYEY